MSLAACVKDPIKTQKLQWSSLNEQCKPTPPLFLTPFPSYGFPLTPFMQVDRQKAAGPLGGTCLTTPAYRLSSSTTSLCGSSESAGQLWSKIYLQNLIRQFSQSLLPRDCGLD